MYLREVFMGPIYWVVLGVLLGTEYFAVSQYKGGLTLVELLQFITIPVYIFLVSTVFFTEDKVLTFELVMFRDWFKVPLGKLLSLLLSLVPFTVVTLLIAEHYHAGTFIVPILTAILFYSTTIIFSTVVGGGEQALRSLNGATIYAPVIIAGPDTESGKPWKPPPRLHGIYYLSFSPGLRFLRRFLWDPVG